MRRQEKRKKFVFIALAILLIISIPLCSIRVLYASKEMNEKDVVDYTNVKPVVLDRNDNVVFENDTLVDYTAYGNTIGLPGFMDNALISRYYDELKPANVSPIWGYRTLEQEPRVMETTLLNKEMQLAVAEAFGGKTGCCFAFNYETGEIYTALSLPEFNPNNPDTSYINRCFDSTFIPGSTMKVITTALAVDQGLDLSSITHYCQGYETLESSPKPIDCTGRHGTIGFSDAIGLSCNCFFAHVASLLNVDQALATLKEMGFNTTPSQEAEPEYIDRFIKKGSSVNIQGNTSFSDVWSFVGQGEDLVNPCDMAMIAAAIVNNGKTAVPYAVEQITNPNKKDKVLYTIPEETQYVNLLSPATAKTTKETWKAGVDKHYYNSFQRLSEKIDYAKTGTAQIDTENGKIRNKTLIGVIEKSKTAFYIVIEDFEDGGIMPVDVANRLAEVLPVAQPVTEEAAAE